ncbi:Peroxidase 4 [Nymphaea thermarum]|nr:Peroxidase 4 [Nymphaea thermarum]
MLADNNIPPPSSNLSTLTSKFQSVALDAGDLVALSGADTIGQAQCSSFKGRLYNDTNQGRAGHE